MTYYIVISRTEGLASRLGQERSSGDNVATEGIFCIFTGKVHGNRLGAYHLQSKKYLALHYMCL